MLATLVNPNPSREAEGFAPLEVWLQKLDGTSVIPLKWGEEVEIIYARLYPSSNKELGDVFYKVRLPESAGQGRAGRVGFVRADYIGGESK